MTQPCTMLIELFILLTFNLLQQLPRNASGLCGHCFSGVLYMRLNLKTTTGIYELSRHVELTILQISMLGFGDLGYQAHFYNFNICNDSFFSRRKPETPDATKVQKQRTLHRRQTLYVASWGLQFQASLGSWNRS